MSRLPCPPPFDHCPVEAFGQGTAFRCVISCLRYLIWHFEGRLVGEDYLIPGHLPDNARGHAIDRTVRALGRLRFAPLIRCRSATHDGVLGRGLPPDVPVQRDNEANLARWLRQVLDQGHPVMAGVDTRRLGPPSDPVRGGPHFVVAVQMSEAQVTFLEPDPPAQLAYPKQGEWRTVPTATFLRAWRDVFCIAIQAAPAGPPS